ncbi:MAG: glycerophosphodiester phosphodiesterase family protein, partial [bacterium]|nr:glycerophosphodiester phosphodiesterase family protein [bacterium]
MSGPLPDRLAFLTARPFAHRGLHGRGAAGQAVSENGMAAFDAAIIGGFGIECDVRASRDGVAFVFHDASLARMTGETAQLADRTAAQLDRVFLPDGGTVPRLRHLLTRIGTDTPLLVEIKTDGGPIARLCQSIAHDLADHRPAPIAVMAFDPNAVHWFARHAPHVLRGLVVTQQGKGRWRGRIERALALWRAKPDFIACDIRDLPS